MLSFFAEPKRRILKTRQEELEDSFEASDRSSSSIFCVVTFS
jgi:hypothetical protein